MTGTRKLAAVTAVIFLFVLTILLLRKLTEQKPLGEPPSIHFSAAMSESERREFLDGEFEVIKDVTALPGPVLETFTEQNGSRILLANPGSEFIVGDVIYDPSVPRERLIFAGVLRERCFVHYEQGGRSHMYVLALFEVNASNALKPLWRGFCTGPAANINELRSRLVGGDCQ